jgi:ankyrin repeat protein
MRNLFKYIVYLVVITGFSSSIADSYQDFFRAVENDNAGTVRELLAKGFDPNTPDHAGQVALYLAMRADSPKVAAVLVANRSLKIDAVNAAGETALMMAALRGNYEWAKILLDSGAQVQRPGWSPVHYAATGPEAKVVALLLDRGADVNAASPNRTTPLMMAARYGTEDSVKLLLARGADKGRVNDRNFTAADFGEMSKREFLQPLLK